MSDQPVTETSARQHTTLTRDGHPCTPSRIRSHNPSKQVATGPQLDCAATGPGSFTYNRVLYQ